MARSSILGSFALVAGLALSGSALADDLTPPSWRFNPGTTVQHWDFSGGPGGGAPDAGPFLNPYGTPMLSPSSGTVWQPSFNGRNDVWMIAGGQLTFDVPNTGVAIHQKELWLQVTFLSIAAVPPPFASVASINGPFTPIGAPIYTTLPNGWVHQLTRWSTPICPQSERVAIFPGLAGAQVFIDQVVIDTQCIPIPSVGSASLLGVAGLCFTRRRRSR